MRIDFFLTSKTDSVQGNKGSIHDDELNFLEKKKKILQIILKFFFLNE